MSSATLPKFQLALDAVESLPVSQREHLLEIVQRRLSENRRLELSSCVEEARSDYDAGLIQRGSVSDLLKELEECGS